MSNYQNFSEMYHGSGPDESDLQLGLVLDYSSGTLTVDTDYGVTTAVNLERIEGTRSDDTFIGNDEENRFSANGGNDTFTGGGGHDSFNDLDPNGNSIITDYESLELIEFDVGGDYHDVETGPMSDLSTLISVTKNATNTTLSFAPASGYTGSVELNNTTNMKVMTTLL